MPTNSRTGQISSPWMNIGNNIHEVNIFPRSIILVLTLFSFSLAAIDLKGR
jgi:hypothetical protein